MEPYNFLPQLPLAVWEKILQHLADRKSSGSPAHAARLLTTSKSLREMVQACESFWRALCIQAGFRQPFQLASSPCGLTDDGTSTSASHVLYKARMQTRWALRKAFKHLQLFLPSHHAFRPGLSIAELEGTERAAGFNLPVQLAELYRYRNGQESGDFAYGARLLGLHEVLSLIKGQQLIQHAAWSQRAWFQGARRSEDYSLPSLQAGDGARPTDDDSDRGVLLAAMATLGLKQTQSRKPANDLAAAYPGCTCGLHQPIPCFYACLPLTELQAGNKQFVYDLAGRIYIASGFVLYSRADSIIALMRSLVS
ncbi:hypothetical protein WJX74_004402 [Apatococcus lobatus]|uniref:F-box domain-containing protein n=1 Tax=Apatococcus lobatus TaxID=904363 RepID=A0AAW1RXN7_9CHLO